MLQHIWKHQTRGVNRFINELKHLKCIFIFYLKYELTSKRIIQFILQNSHHKFEEIQGVWREGEIHYISVTRWNGTESQTFKNTRCKTRYMPIYMYVYESKRDYELIWPCEIIESYLIACTQYRFSIKVCVHESGVGGGGANEDSETNKIYGNTYMYPLCYWKKYELNFIYFVFIIFL